MPLRHLLCCLFLLLFATSPVVAQERTSKGGEPVAPDRRPLPLIIAHRGASYDAPENTLAALDLAWKRGADGVEFDVFLTRDKQIIATHDKTTKKFNARDLTIADETLLTLKQLDVGAWKNEIYRGETMPSLLEIFVWLDNLGEPGTGIAITESRPPMLKAILLEVKCGPEIIPVLKRNIEQFSPPSSPGLPEFLRNLKAIGFDFDTMSAIKKELPFLPVFWVVAQKQNKQTRVWEPTIDELIAKAKAANFQALDLKDVPAIDAEAVRKVHAAGLELHTWTVNDPKAAWRLHLLGVDGITTDRPGWLRKQLQMRQHGESVKR